MESEWARIHKESEPHRVRFERLLIVYGLIDFMWLNWSSDHGHFVQSLAALLAASQLPILILVWQWEYGVPTWNPKQQLRALARTLRRYDPRIQSWAFMGDAIAFGPMVVFTSLVLGSIHHQWFDTGWLGWVWLGVSLVLGAVFSLSFRRGEGDAYDVLRYFAYSKLLHNGVAYTVIGGYIVHSVLMAAIYGWHWGLWWKTAAMLAFLALWAGAAAADGWRAGLPEGHPWRLYGRNLHPQADARGHALGYEIPDVPTWDEYRAAEPNAAWWTKVFHTRKLIEAWRSRHS